TDSLEALTAMETLTIDRIDIRPSKGVAKVVFEQDNWEVQVHGSSGDIVSVARRHADWIETLHDGSIISDGFKLLVMNLLGVALVLLSITGVWMWYGPKLVRRMNLRRK
ncbi:MAG: PepSY domain-containing protein, partial [Cyclobacteriaceae bacterium]|nr:PepSY domain-containing protein [Cyclobacteriaceae bacterium]